MPSETIILLVEDQAPDVVAKTIAKMLRPDIPGIRVDFAATVAAGHEKFQSYEAGSLFCAVLDYMLPKEHVGQHPEGDRTLCLAIRKSRGGRTPHIIHVSGFGNDKDLARHVEDVHGEAFDARSAISKGEGSTAAVANRIRQLYFEDMFSQRLAELFPEESISAGIEGGSARHGMLRGSMTIPLLELTLELAANWRHLSPEFKERVKRILDVDDSAETVVVAPKLPRIASESEPDA